MTKEAGFLETIVGETKNVNNSVATSSKEEVKTMPSLFDTMLSNANSANLEEVSSVANEKVVPSNNNQTVKANTNETGIVKDSLLKDATSSELNGQIIQTKNSTPTISLLDKLVQEASAQVQNETLNTGIEKNSVQTLVLNPNPQPEVKTPTLPTQEQPEVVTTSQKNMLTQVASKETTPQKVVAQTAPTSLLDRLLQEANVQIQAGNTNAVIEGTSQNDEILVSKETIPTPMSKVVVSEQTNVVVQAVTQEVSNVETKLPNSEPAPSLLDKLIKEANVQIQNESIKAVNTNEVEVVTTTQIKDAMTKEVVQVQEQKVVVEIKDVKNQDTLISNQDMTKNPKEATTQIQTKVSTDVSLVNNASDKVAQELAKVTQTLNETTSLTKEDLTNVKSQVENSSEKQSHKSLLDKLLEETKATIKTTQETAEVKTSAAVATATPTKMATEPILTNIYLSSVNKASQEASLEKNHEAKTIVANATSVKDVQKGADLLNLGLQNSEVVLQEEEFKQNVKNEFLSKLSINRDIIKHDITKMSEEIVAQSKILKNEAVMASTTNLLAAKNLPEIEVNVSAANAYTIENRIIGARQQMGSMMSDLARNMYLNYKPPVTAFRMNLNPGNLGSIAVLIKNDKDNGLSISLNMSNVATLDSIVDNQAALRASLAKNFNTNTNINLEFNMQEGKQEGQNGQQNKKQQQNNHQATNDILESLSNQNDSNKVTNYM